MRGHLELRYHSERTADEQILKAFPPTIKKKVLRSVIVVIVVCAVCAVCAVCKTGVFQVSDCCDCCVCCVCCVCCLQNRCVFCVLPIFGAQAAGFRTFSLFRRQKAAVLSCPLTSWSTQLQYSVIPMSFLQLCRACLRVG